MSRRLSPLSAGRLFVLGATALIAGSLRSATAKAGASDSPSRTIKGVILDLDNNPASGVVVVIGLAGTGTSNHQVLTTDGEGRFSWPIPAGGVVASVYAHKPGRAIANSRWVDAGKTRDDIELHLRETDRAPFAAVLVDGDGKPIAGARVRVEKLALSRESKLPGGGSRVSTGLIHFHREILEGSPLESLVVATTDERGAFSFRSFGSSGTEPWLRLAVTAPDGRAMRVKAPKSSGGAIGRMMDPTGFVAAPAGKETCLVASPAARVQGRVVTKLPGVSVSGLKVWYGGSRGRPGRSPYFSNFGDVTRTDAGGRFTFDGLDEGTINIYASGGEPGTPWTYRAVQDIELKSGWTRAAMIELIRGVEVEGKVLAQPTGQALQGVNIGMYGPFRPHSGSETLGATTDAEGRYRYHLPPGKTYFYVMGHPTGHADRTVTIPEGVARFEVPPIVVGHRLIVGGRITDDAGRPVPGATVTCVGEDGRAFGGVDTVTDSAGAFRLPPSPNNSIPIGEAARLRIRLRDGSEHAATAVPADDGSITVKLPGSTGKS